MVKLEKLSKQKVNNAIEFVRSLKHVKDPWHGVQFDLLPWEQRVITDVYGTLNPDGTRRYRTVYIELPKKGGKSEFLAAIGLKQLCADDEWYGEVYGCAADRGQASIIFDVAVAMVDQDEELKSMIKIVPSKHRMVYLPTGSFYQVCSSEAYSKHGLNVSACLFDELHAQPNRALYDVMTFGSGDARRQPLYFFITTAGRDPERTSIGWEVHKKAEDILLGKKSDPTFYPVIFGFDPDNKRIWTGWESERYVGKRTKEIWRDKKIWSMVNPSDGITLRQGAVQESFDSANGNDADEVNFQQLRLNIWVKIKTSKWLSIETWNKNGGIISREKLYGRSCFGGLDLSDKLDITAFVLLFPPNEEFMKWEILPYFWMPEDNLMERVKKDHVRYDKWKREGLLETTPGNVIDYGFTLKKILDLRDKYEIREIGYDPWNAQQMAIDLEDNAIHPEPVRQGFKSMSPPMKEVEALLTGGKMNHGNNEILNWMFDNLEVKNDENYNIRPIKGQDKNKKIDGFVALINAMARAMTYEESIYEKRGMRVL